MKIILCIISVLIFCISTDYFPQSSIDTINKPIQFRRCAEIPSGYQSYEERYRGKSLQEEKRKLYPINQRTSGTGIWTELNPKVPRVDYLGINFVNTDTGWACGDLGTIIKTTDGGESWNTLETNISTPILKVRSYDGQTVIAAGFDGLILRSTDGSESWLQVTSNVTGDLWGLQMINDTLGWACGNYNSLTKTTDGGETWTRIYTPGYTGNYWWIDFFTKDDGFIAADGYVLRTSDGGNNWEIIPAGDSYPLFCLDVIDSLHIAAAGYGGTDYPSKNIYSSDGGNTWINGYINSTGAINCIHYINRDTGYISMDEQGLMKTTNRGQSWDLLDPNSPNFQGEYEFQLFLPSNIGYDAGSYLRLFKANGNIDIWHKMIVNNDLSAVFFNSEQKGFVLSQGTYGTLFGTINGGINWDTIQGVPGGNYITFTDSLIGYIGTTTSKIYKTTDRGDNWYETNGITNIIAKIFFVNSQTGWAVGGTNIFKTTDSGENWFEQTNNGWIFTSVYFIDSLTGWASQLGGRPFKTTDGGANWIQQTNLNIYQSRDVFFRDYLNGFILESNNLYKTTDGGNNFTLIPDITGYSVAAKFRNFGDSTIFIIGYKTYRSVDGGENWTEIPELDLVKISGLSLLNSGLGYATGDLGLILKYYDSTYTPVELIEWTAKNEGDNVLLKWVTSTETNNKGFEVERSQTSNMKGQTGWEKIAFVEGNGTTTETHSYSFNDKNVLSVKYKYRLKQIDYDGSYNYSREIEVEVNAPDKFALYQNYPNPFNPVSQINYQIPVKGFVSLKVYDTLGEEVATLVNEEKSAGSYEVKFDGSDLPSGVYIYRLVVEKFVEFKKMIIIK
jgi:photosystem II stability/assembly factor-like uncharacterized protein